MDKIERAFRKYFSKMKGDVPWELYQVELGCYRAATERAAWIAKTYPGDVGGLIAAAIRGEDKP